MQNRVSRHRFSAVDIKLGTSTEYRRMEVMFRVIGVALLVSALPACVGSIPRIPIRAELNGQEVVTTVDSEIAAYYATNYLSGRRSRPELDQIIDVAHRQLREKPPTRSALASLSRDYSTDFAALLLWRALATDPNNQVVSKIFAREFDRIMKRPDSGAAIERRFPRDYLILFVPGWFYQSQPQTGADFAKPRAVLRAVGARTVLLNIDENGSVESNAERIANAIVELGRAEKNVILVSASKAGPEVALALSTVRRSAKSHSVKAWVNIGGVLHGSVLADKALGWPARWYVKLFLIGGGSFDGIESLTTARSVARAKVTSLPPEVLVINYVGIPLSGQVSDGARTGYWLLSSEGPNDGLTQILDEILPGSVTIAELGLDHFFDHPNIHIKTVALAWTVIDFVANSVAGVAQPGAPPDAVPPPIKWTLPPNDKEVSNERCQTL